MCLISLKKLPFNKNINNSSSNIKYFAFLPSLNHPYFPLNEKAKKYGICFTNPPILIRYQAQIGSLHHPRPNTHHESTLSIVVLTFHNDNASGNNWPSASTPTATSIVPLYLLYRPWSGLLRLVLWQETATSALTTGLVMSCMYRSSNYWWSLFTKCGDLCISESSTSCPLFVLQHEDSKGTH